jgi:hypothetical protein
LVDRQQHAPLADLFAKAAPDSDPAWRSEQFAEVAGKQLQMLLETWGEAAPQGAANPRLTIVSNDLESTPLRPRTDVVFQDESLEVRRQRAEQPVGVQGEPAFAASLRELRAVYAVGDEPPHGKFKITRATMDAERGQTVAVVEIFGPSAAWSGRRVQQTATWHCDWERSDHDELPRLTRVVVSDYEEILPRRADGGSFVDCTEAILGQNQSYRTQLAYGADYWYGNMDVAFGIHQGNQGLALGDADGDGRDDLFVCQPAGLPSRLYLQQADGTLRDHTAESGLEWLDASRSALFVDLDNDGDQDLILSLNYSLMIFENLGAARFVKRTRIDIHSWPTSIAAADVDNDGDIDIFVCGYNPRGETAPGDIFANPVPYHDANNGARNFLMRNDGDWNFADVTQTVGLDQNNYRFSFAATWEDYDNDGDQDLYVANDFGRNNLYRNLFVEQGECRFVDVAAEAGVEDIAAGMSVAWGDYNHDGLMDLYVSNMFSSAGNRITTQQQFLAGEDIDTRESMQRHARGNSLFQNQGDGTFRDVSDDAAVTLGRWAWGSLWIDVNNDRWEDLYVANGFFTTPDTGDL